MKKGKSYLIQTPNGIKRVYCKSVTKTCYHIRYDKTGNETYLRKADFESSLVYSALFSVLEEL